MKGYNTDIGYMGWVPEVHDYALFDSEMDYKEYILETETEANVD